MLITKKGIYRRTFTPRKRKKMYLFTIAAAAPTPDSFPGWLKRTQKRVYLRM